jgi:hypothetical protein
MAKDIDELISEARAYTELTVQDANITFTQVKNDYANTKAVVPREPKPPAPLSKPLDSIPVDLPTLTPVTLELPNEPAAPPALIKIPTLDVGEVPTFTVGAPSIDLPNLPQGITPFNIEAPTINSNFAFPAPPELLIGDAPVLPTRVEPAAPTITIPDFTSERPEDLESAAAIATDIKTAMQAEYEGQSSSMQKAAEGYVAAMMTKIDPNYSGRLMTLQAELQQLKSGSVGLNSAGESGFYERARSRNSAEAIRVREQAMNEAAGRGFTIPTGALLSAIQQARQAGADNNAKASAEIAIAQAQLAQKNMEFAFTTSAALATTAVNVSVSYFQNLIAVNGQALDYAKSVLGSLVEVYNLSVKAYEAKLSSYRADAEVYDTRVKAAMAGIELYSKRIEALSVLTNADKSQIDIYRARIETLSSMANVYRTQIDAVLGRAQVEKTKVEIFQAQVQGYGAQVQAKNAEFQAFNAALAGQEAKVSIFNSQIQGYGQQVNAYKTTVDAKAAALQALTASNQAQSANYQAAVSGFQAVVQARGAKAKADVDIQQALLNNFASKMQALVANATVQQTYYKVVSDREVALAEVAIKAELGRVDAAQTHAKTLVDIGLASGNMFGQVSSAALSGMNTLISQSASKQE